LLIEACSGLLPVRVHKVIELLDVLSGRIEHEFHRVIAFYDLTILPFYSIAVLRYLLPVTSRELQEICHNTPLRDFLIKLIAIEAQDIERSFDDLGSVSLPDRSCKNSPNEIAADPPGYRGREELDEASRRMVAGSRDHTRQDDLTRGSERNTGGRNDDFLAHVP